MWLWICVVMCMRPATVFGIGCIIVKLGTNIQVLIYTFMPSMISSTEASWEISRRRPGRRIETKNINMDNLKHWVFARNAFCAIRCVEKFQLRLFNNPETLFHCEPVWQWHWRWCISITMFSIHIFLTYKNKLKNVYAWNKCWRQHIALHHNWAMVWNDISDIFEQMRMLNLCKMYSARFADARPHDFDRRDP